MKLLFSPHRSFAFLLLLFLSACGEKPATSDEAISPPQTQATEATPSPPQAKESDPDAPIMIAAGKDEKEIPLSIPSTPPTSPTTVPPSQPGSRPLTNEEQKVVIDRILAESAQHQAEGLGNGTVKVNGAWHYTGYSTLSPNPEAAIEARLVAVDITISGHTPWFDMDDIEIADGAVEVSYGSDAQIEPLQSDGSLMADDAMIPAAPLASRWLLIYAYPKSSPSFRLYYWGKNLTPTPVAFGESRLSLPYPPIEPEPAEPEPSTTPAAP